jgi:hypothetical protein
MMASGVITLRAGIVVPARRGPSSRCCSALIIGLRAVRHVLVTLLALALLLGIFWIVNGTGRAGHRAVPPGDGLPRLDRADGRVQRLRRPQEAVPVPVTTSCGISTSSTTRCMTCAARRPGHGEGERLI